MNQVCLDGKMIDGNEPILTAANRGFRYGDALFETMRLTNGKISLASWHFERLFAGLVSIRIEIPELFTPEKIIAETGQLSKRNKCEKLARVRLTVFRSDGELYEPNNSLQYLIECRPLDESVNPLNETGLVIDIFPDARKSCDKFSNLKSANYLPCVMAAQYARDKKLDDCLLLNVHERICEAAIANIFWIKNEEIFTPPLSEGCVAGVMRRYLMEKIEGIMNKGQRTMNKGQGARNKEQGARDKEQDSRFRVQEKICEVVDLEEADEVFLTNAIKGIRWVGQFRDKKYSFSQSRELFSKYIQNLG